MKVELFDLKFDAITFAEARQRICDVARERARPIRFVVTPNVDHIVRLREMPHLKPIYDQAHFTFADGMPVVLASKLLGRSIPERVTGADLLPALCEDAARQSLRVFMMGGPPSTAELALKRMQEKFGAIACDSYCPPMGFETNPDENSRIIERINRFNPDILFVGVGSPKQERWVFDHQNELHCGIALGIGAAIEFAAGTVSRAPKFMQKSGTEWIWRLLQDPKRLAKRYVKDAVFLKIVWEEWRK
jgi:N-acetylglucosaminyldiphosphoundecaprenol N-acetyl-beta-D-mannosaminyltransferase